MKKETIKKVVNFIITVLTAIISSFCYEGGLDKNGNPADTRTPEQKKTMEDLLYGLAIDYPDAEILGHCDLPGVRKACPSFDVATWLAEINFGL